ncbi:MAG: hypothetical protein HQ495_16160 [Alphaproteobacteria bacterium]|nr:hypothetical protein [Alphaproteobacteria bacterium]
MPSNVLLTPRSLADARLDGPAIETFKADARSRVWRVNRDGVDLVVKRFEYSPWRQAFGRMLGIHPAQLELAAQRTLEAAGVRVITTIDCGMDKGRAWLATPAVGTSLQRALASNRDDHAALMDAAATLTLALIEAGFTFKDLKPSNILIDNRGDAWLIDVGSVKNTTSRKAVRRMLEVMRRVLARDRVASDLIERFCDATTARIHR